MNSKVMKGILRVMGISASQARLLTITARLTSNEYESQQISNAKMRLATQSEQASSDYIAALNTKQLLFTTYDAQGSSVNEKLTANSLFQYADMKNQYALINTSGQALISQQDAHNFEEADNLDEFLSYYGITKEYKTTSLQKNMELLSGEIDYTYKDKTGTTQSINLQDSYKAWEEAVNYQKQRTDFSGSYLSDDGETTINYENVSSDRAYEIEKNVALREYNQAIANYDDTVAKYNAGALDKSVVDTAMDKLTQAKIKYSNTITYDNWLMSKAAYTTGIAPDGSTQKVETEEYTNVQKYFEVLEEVLAEAEDIGTTMDDLYTYSDEEKATWYTNLWYRLNGESSEKSAKGLNAANYSVLDSKLASSNQWIQDALSQGIVTLEVVSNTDTTNAIPNENNPTVVNLKGISWKTTTYTNVSSFTEQDDDAAIATAEAEYQRKNNEINAKDQKYENKIKTLDTEHNSLQTEYESVKSAMEKNVSRSYKTFSG